MRPFERPLNSPPALGTALRTTLRGALFVASALALASCTDSLPPDGTTQLRLDLEFREHQGPGTTAARAGETAVTFPLRAGGESLDFDRVRARAIPIDAEGNPVGAAITAEDPIDDGETRYRLELQVPPAPLYRIEVDALGSVDPDTSLGGVLFYGRTELVDVGSSSEESVTILLDRQFPEVTAELLSASEELLLSWTEIPEARRYRIRGRDDSGGAFEAIAVDSDTTFATPPRLGGGAVRSFRVRAEFAERAAGAWSVEAAVQLGEPVAPGAIVDLAATAVTDSSLVLSWTATGDDGAVGRASAYDLRLATVPIDVGNFDLATPIPGVPTPAVAGTPDSMLVQDLAADTIYSFGLYAIDDVPLRSPLATVSVRTAPLPDRTPPARVTDFRALAVNAGGATLLWTAPGDDASFGRATAYDARIATFPIDPTNFSTATPIAGFPAPAPAGSAESFVLTSLGARTTYYVALVAADEVGNRSLLSNVPSFTTLDVVAPDAVTDLAAVALDENRVAITWTAPADEDGSTVARYELRHAPEPLDEVNFATATEAPAPDPADPGTVENVVVGGFARDTQVYFALRSFDTAGNAAPLSNLAAASTPDLTPPAPIADLAAASVDETTLRVTWTATGDDADDGTASSYDLRLATFPIDGSNFESANAIPLAPPEATGTSESVEVSGLLPGQLYYLRLRVTDDDGNASALSNLASATPLDATPPAAAVLAVELTTTSSIVVAWTAPGDDGATGRAAAYDLRYSDLPIDASNFANALPIPIPAPQPAGSKESAEISGLAEATTYYIALISEDEASNSSPLSNVVSATTGTAPPVAPSGLAAAALAPTSIGLVWQDNAGNETNYEVERRRSDESTFTRIVTLGPGAGAVEYTDDSVLERRTYTYRVRATNAGGPSAYSNEASATTPISAPEGFAATAQAHDEIRLSWDFGSPAPEGFRIERLGRSIWETIATLPGNARSHVDTGLEYLTTYTYRMLAFDGNLVSAYTPEVSEETPDEPAFCSIDPPSLDFGTVDVGDADTLTVSIVNTGGQILIGDVVLEDCAAGFSVLDGSGLNLQRGEGRDVRVIFAPETDGSVSCVLVGPSCEPVAIDGAGSAGPNYWSDRFAAGDLGVNGDVRALVPAFEGLYAGGGFTLAGDQVTSYTAQFIDDTWFGMGPSLSGRVRALANTDFGLYCGGDFTTQTNFDPHHIAWWSGSSWEALNSSPDGSVRALVQHESFRIAVGGTFTSEYLALGGKPDTGPPGLAEWVPCPPIGSRGMANGPRSDATLDPLNRGCNFYSDLLAADPNGSIEVATVWQGELYVGGTFTQIGGLDIAYLARYDVEFGWFPVGFNGGVNNPVYALYPGETMLWVGGQFTAVDGLSSRGIASWSGTSWTPRTAGEDFRTTYAITEFDGLIVIGGSFTTSNGSEDLDRIAALDGSTWYALGSGIDTPGGVVYALLPLDGAVYVGGTFSSAGGFPAQNISRWEPPIPR